MAEDLIAELVLNIFFEALGEGLGEAITAMIDSSQSSSEEVREKTRKLRDRLQTEVKAEKLSIGAIHKVSMSLVKKSKMKFKETNEKAILALDKAIKKLVVSEDEE